MKSIHFHIKKHIITSEINQQISLSLRNKIHSKFYGLNRNQTRTERFIRQQVINVIRGVK